MNQLLRNGFVKEVIGYCDPLCLRAGQSMQFYLSSHSPGEATLQLVELVSGDDRPHGTGLIERAVATDLPNMVSLSEQPLFPGSCATVASMPAIDEGRFQLLVYPTLPESQPVCVANLAGVAIMSDITGFWVEGGPQVTMPIHSHRWYRLTFTFGAS